LLFRNPEALGDLADRPHTRLLGNLDIAHEQPPGCDLTHRSIRHRRGLSLEVHRCFDPVVIKDSA
jgi:hypothetical protein